MESETMRERQDVCLLSELKEKEVVTLGKGRRLGHISDVEVDLQEERITAIVLPREGGRISFFDEREVWRIPWEKIKRIGEDVILVEADSVLAQKERRGFLFFASKE